MFFVSNLCPSSQAECRRFDPGLPRCLFGRETIAAPTDALARSARSAQSWIDIWQQRRASRMFKVGKKQDADHREKRPDVTLPVGQYRTRCHSIGGNVGN